MKRQKFTLGNVLRYYEVQKERAEFELQQASRLLREVDEEIYGLQGEIIRVANVVREKDAAMLTIAAWLACYRKAEHLDRLQELAKQRRRRQAELVEKQHQARKRWAIAEETLRSLQQSVDGFNHAQAAKEQQELLDEAVIRKWLEHGQEMSDDSPKE